MRYGFGRYLIRVVAGTLWFLVMGMFAAVLAVGAVSLVVDFSLGGLVWLTVMVLAIGLPIRRQWIDDRAEVLTFFKRVRAEPAPEHPAS